MDSQWEMRLSFFMASSESSNWLVIQGWSRHSSAEGRSWGFFFSSFYRRSKAYMLTCLKAGRSKFGSSVLIFLTSLGMLWSKNVLQDSSLLWKLSLGEVGVMNWKWRILILCVILVWYRWRWIIMINIILPMNPTTPPYLQNLWVLCKM